MDVGMHKAGLISASSTPMLGIKEIEKEQQSENYNLRDIKLAQFGYKLKRAGSEDNLFFKRCLCARSCSQLSHEIFFKKSDFSDILVERHSSLDADNKRYISKFISDASSREYANVPDDEGDVLEDETFEGKGDTKYDYEDCEDYEDEVLSIIQDKYEYDSRKFINWHKNADFKEVAGWLVELSSNGFNLHLLGKCSLRQQAVIAQYVSQMLRYGSKKEFAEEVFSAMIMLYTTKIFGYTIEECLPEFIKPEDYSRDNIDNRSPLTFAKIYKDHRKWITDHLEKAIEIRGGNYDAVIPQYCRCQQGDSSWCEMARIFKGFYLLQRANFDSARFYFLVGRRSRDGAAKQQWDFGRQSFIEQFYAKYPPNSPEYDMFFKTVAAYQAFVAIALNYIDGILGLDKKRGVLMVFRVSSRRYVFGQLQGILDSASLLCPVRFMIDKNSTVMNLVVPLCDIKFVYFLSRELCDLGGLAAEEREILCDLINAKISDITGCEL